MKYGTVHIGCSGSTVFIVQFLFLVAGGLDPLGEIFLKKSAAFSGWCHGMPISFGEKMTD